MRFTCHSVPSYPARLFCFLHQLRFRNGLTCKDDLHIKISSHKADAHHFMTNIESWDNHDSTRNDESFRGKTRLSDRDKQTGTPKSLILHAQTSNKKHSCHDASGMVDVFRSAKTWCSQSLETAAKIACKSERINAVSLKCLSKSPNGHIYKQVTNLYKMTPSSNALMSEEAIPMQCCVLIVSKIRVWKFSEIERISSKINEACAPELVHRNWPAFDSFRWSQDRQRKKPLQAVTK